MLVWLFVHGSYYGQVEVCDEAPSLAVPLYEARIEAGLRRWARFGPVPGTAGALWECTDPSVALRGGRLVAVGEGV